MGQRAVVLFTNGNSFSNIGTFFHNGGNTIGITIEEIWDQFQQTGSLDECCRLLQLRTQTLNLAWGFRDSSQVLKIEDDESKNLRMLNMGDDGVLIVDIKNKKIKKLQGDRWARTYSVKQFAELQRKRI